MKKRFRKSGAILLALLAVIGGAFSWALVGLGLLVTAVVGGVKWLKAKPEWLKPVWYIALIAAAVVMYFYPAARARAAVSSCSDLPAPAKVLARGDSVDVVRSSTALSPRDVLLNEVRQDSIRLQGQAAEVETGGQLVIKTRRVQQAMPGAGSKRSADLEDAASKLEMTLQPLRDPKVFAERKKVLVEALASLEQRAATAGDDAIKALRSELEGIILEKSFDAAYTSVTSVKRLLNEVAREDGGLVNEPAAYRVWLDGRTNQLVYEESVHLNLANGRFESLDLSEFDLGTRTNPEGTPEITLRSREMAERKLSRSELAAVTLKEQPTDLTIVNRMVVTPGQTEMCRGVMWFAFRHSTITWPQPFNIELRGMARTKLDSSVPFQVPVSKNLKVAELRLPEFSLFKADMPLTPKGGIAVDGARFDVYEPAGAGTTVNAGQLRVHGELLPPYTLFRNRWVQQQSGMFFPVGWLPALIYLFVSSLVSEVLFKKP